MFWWEPTQPRLIVGAKKPTFSFNHISRGLASSPQQLLVAHFLALI